MNSKRKAYYHLPGLFEFYELYRRFLPLFFQQREYFYDWCEIGSIYGAPGDCLWGGGRVGFGDAKPKEVLDLLHRYHLSGRLTFSNSMLRPEHLKDQRCNALCDWFAKDGHHGVIVHSDLLVRYLQRQYPSLYLVSSTTKVLTEFQDLKKELQRQEFQFVVPDFRLNRAFGLFQSLSQDEKNKMEFLCNECCWVGCTERKQCYENVSQKALGEATTDHICHSPGAEDGYRFSKAMENPGFVGISNIIEEYLPMGFSQFKMEGRGLGSAVVLEMLLYYMVKPEYQIRVREAIYLDSMLDLF